MKIRYFLIFALLALGFSLLQLLTNARQASSLKNQILAKDKQAQDVTADLNGLTSFSLTHMNASTTVFLTDSYNRAVEAAKAAQTPPPVPGDVYTKAQRACSSRADSITQTKCVQDYLAKNTTPAPQPKPVVLPEQAKFTYTTKSPAWTTDMAGLSLVAAGTSLILAGYFWFMRRF